MVDPILHLHTYFRKEYCKTNKSKKNIIFFEEKINKNINLIYQFMFVFGCGILTYAFAESGGKSLIISGGQYMKGRSKYLVAASSDDEAR